MEGERLREREGERLREREGERTGERERKEGERGSNANEYGEKEGEEEGGEGEGEAEGERGGEREGGETERDGEGRGGGREKREERERGRRAEVGRKAKMWEPKSLRLMRWPLHDMGRKENGGECDVTKGESGSNNKRKGLSISGKSISIQGIPTRLRISAAEFD